MPSISAGLIVQVLSASSGVIPIFTNHLSSRMFRPKPLYTASDPTTILACDSPIFIEGKIEAKHNRGKVSLRIGLPPCPHHGSVRLRLSTRQSAGASPQSPAP